MSFVHVASTTRTRERFLTEVSFNMQFKFHKCLKDIATVFTDKFAHCSLKSNTAWLMHSNRLHITLWRNRYNFVSSTGWRASQRFLNCARCVLLTVTVWQRMLQDTGTNQQRADKAKNNCYALYISGFLAYTVICYVCKRWSLGIKKKCTGINLTKQTDINTNLKLKKKLCHRHHRPIFSLKLFR